MPNTSHEFIVVKILNSLGPERVEDGYRAFANYGHLCGSWRSCFLARALGICELSERKDLKLMYRIAKILDATPNEVETFILVFDDQSSQISTRRLQEMCSAFLARHKSKDQLARIRGLIESKRDPGAKAKLREKLIARPLVKGD